MVQTHVLLESFEPWFTLNEDVTECRKHMEVLDDLIPKFQDFSVVITEEDLIAVKAAMHLMEHVSKTATPLRKPEGYPSYSDADEPEAQTFSGEEDPAHEDMGGDSSQGSPSPPPGRTSEDPEKTPSRPSSRRDELDDPEEVKGSNQRGRRSKNRIDSDSDDSTSKKSTTKKDSKVVGEFNMKLRGQEEFEEISLRTENPRKRSRKDMESTSGQPKERPTQTPQGEKILYSRP